MFNTKFSIGESVKFANLPNIKSDFIQNIDTFSTGEQRYWISNHIWNESELLKV